MNREQHFATGEQALSVGDQRVDRVELPMLNWPMDLFKSDVHEAELVAEDMPIWMHVHQGQAVHA